MHAMRGTWVPGIACIALNIHATADGVGVPIRRITMPNFVKISQTVAEILRCFDFSVADGGARQGGDH